MVFFWFGRDLGNRDVQALMPETGGFAVTVGIGCFTLRCKAVHPQQVHCSRTTNYYSLIHVSFVRTTGSHLKLSLNRV